MMYPGPLQLGWAQIYDMPLIGLDKMLENMIYPGPLQLGSAQI